MNENDKTLQIMVEYYRNKYYQLEHDFLVYKITAENIIQQLKNTIEESSGNVSEETDESVPENKKK